MSFVATKAKFHVALDGVGLILQGAPDRIGYQQAQAPVYGTRFASGDRSYNDLSQWWYFFQTSWSAGFKDDIQWSDDAKFYYSTNIDPFTTNGGLQLSSGLTLENDFADQITVGSFETPVSTGYNYLGTDKTSSSAPVIYRAPATPSGTWTDIGGAFIPTTRTLMTEILAHKQKIYFTSIGTGATYIVGKCDEDGANPVDHSSAIATACDGITGTSSYCAAEDGNTIWVSFQGTAAQNYIAKSVDGGSNWTKVLSTGYEKVLCILPIGGDIYFLTVVANTLRFKFYDTSEATTTTIYTFPARSLVLSNAGDTGTASRRALQFFSNKVVVSKRDEIWEYTISTGAFTRIWSRDETKASISSTLAIGDAVGNDVNGLQTGAVLHANRLYWINLIKDLSGNFFNGKRDISDADTTSGLKPLHSNGTIMFWVDNNDFTKLYKDSGYKGTADKNYLVFSNFDNISGIDKLAYSATILFKPFASGQSIVVEYTTGELSSSTTWTALGTASHTLDGASVTEKTFLFGASVTFKKIWFRVKLNGGGTNTPTLTDLVMEYQPFPTFKKTWALNVNCGDEVKMLDGALVETTGRELKGRLERAWWTKSLLDFQDFDYATTQLDGALDASTTTITVDNHGTYDFPEQGRIRIDDEEITYTGKTPTTFTGCTRGARGTRAATHSDNAVVNNAYKVLITDLSARIPIALEGKNLESTVLINLREV